jgi:hypothetical protein
MTGPDTPASPAASPAGAGLLPWLLFGPPAVMVGLRWVLSLLAARGAPVSALPLRALAAPETPMDLLWPWLAGALMLAALTGLVVWLGWRRVRGPLAAAWVLLWLGGSGAQLQRHLDVRALSPQPDEVVTVLAAQPKAPSLRSTGGTELVLQRPGPGAPQALLTDEPAAAALKAGDRLVLARAQGRFGGQYVTGWRAAPAR